MAKRLIPSLTVDRNGRLAEAVAFGLEDPGNPLQVAQAYSDAGADELFVASRDTSLHRLAEFARRLSGSLRLPFSIQAEGDEPETLAPLLAAGATRIAIESTALCDPDAIARLARTFGSEAIAVVIRAETQGDVWRVVEGTGNAPTQWLVPTWARVIEAQGAGEVVLRTRSPDTSGQDVLDLLEHVTHNVGRPVTAACDPASREDVFDVLMIGDADGVLLESLVHSGRETLVDLKRFLDAHGLTVRPR